MHPDASIFTLSSISGCFMASSGPPIVDNPYVVEHPVQLKNPMQCQESCIQYEKANCSSYLWFEQAPTGKHFHPRGFASRSLYSTILGLLLFLSLGFSPFKVRALAWCACAIIDFLGAKRNIPKVVLSTADIHLAFSAGFFDSGFSAGCIKPALDARFSFFLCRAG